MSLRTKELFDVSRSTAAPPTPDVVNGSIDPRAAGHGRCMLLIGLACWLALSGCASSYPLPKARPATNLVDVYRSTLLQCAGAPTDSRQRDDTESLVFGHCSVELVGGYVVSQRGDCSAYLKCR